jgi:hypothetical protein
VEMDALMKVPVLVFYVFSLFSISDDRNGWKFLTRQCQMPRGIMGG